MILRNLVFLAFLLSPTAESDEPFQLLDISPVLAQLKQKVEAGDQQAVDAFWADARKRHTPLIELDPRDPKRVIVSFVYRSGPNVKAILLPTQLTHSRGVVEQGMTHLAHTDVWYKAFNLRADLRFTYFFLVDPSPSAAASSLANPNTRELDPLNPKQLVAEGDRENPGATVLGGSIAEMPLAPPEPWITRQPATPAGKVEMQRFQSRLLKNSRRIWTYLPRGYSPAHPPYPLLIAFDGRGCVSTTGMNAPVILDNLITARKIPPLVALFIESPWEVRLRELTNDHAFVDFLANEILPWAHQQWNITRNPQQTIVNGVSAGGLTSSYVAFERPDLFGNVLSLSGAYWRGNEGDDEHFEWLTEQFERSKKLPIRFVLQVGVLERIPTPNNGPSLHAANFHLRDVLIRKGYDVDFSECPGAHEFISWRDGLAEGLIWIFAR